jgi:hypothetical protein
MYIRWVRDVRCNFDNNVDDAPERDASSNPLKKSVRLFDNNVDDAPERDASSNPLKKGVRLFDNNVVI